jgi:hypothetical protein
VRRFTDGAEIQVIVDRSRTYSISIRLDDSPAANLATCQLSTVRLTPVFYNFGKAFIALIVAPPPTTGNSAQL